MWLVLQNYGWEKLQSFSISGLPSIVQELAFLLDTLKEFTGKNCMGQNPFGR